MSGDKITASIKRWLEDRRNPLISEKSFGAKFQLTTKKA